MIKRNPTLDENMEQQLIQLRGDMEAAREIASLKDDPRWLRIREIVKAHLNNCESVLDGFKDLSDKGQSYYLKERADMKWFLSLVDEAEYRISELNREIQDTKTRMEDRHKSRTLTTAP